MSHCLQCSPSTPHSSKTLVESCKQLPVDDAPPFPCCGSRGFRDDLPPSPYTPCTEYPTCLRSSPSYSLHFGLGYLHDCLACYQSNFPHDYAKQTADKCHHVDRYLHPVDGYDLATGVDQRTRPPCTCKMRTRLTHPAPLNERYSKRYAEKLTAGKYGTHLPEGHFDLFSIHDSCKIFPSYDEQTPVKYEADKPTGVSLTMEKTDKKPEFQDCSELEDILVWKKKHLDQLQMQQTEVSENNITDELKDIQTSSAVFPAESSAPSPLRNDRTLEDIPGKTTRNSPGLEISADSFETLRVELRRQELRVKLYESMLRKHRSDLKTLQSTLQDQKVSYEEQIATLKVELFQLREIHEVKLTPTGCPALESLSKEVQTEAGSYRSGSSPDLCVPHATCPARDCVYVERQQSEDSAESSGADASRETQLSRLEHQIRDEEHALGFLRDDLANKDHHLKTLRMTLRELSSSNCELLEKNFELETLLSLRQSRAPRATHVDALESRLLKEIDACISELGCVADALLALSSGFDPLPLLLLSGHGNDGAASSGVEESAAQSTESRLGKVAAVQAAIEGLRELIIQRILSDHYRQSSDHNPGLTL